MQAMSQHNQNTDHDPILDLVRVAKMESVPKTDVSANVLRQIRVQDTRIAQKPLVWLVLGSTATAVAVAIVSAPVFMSLLDPLNVLFQSTPASLL